MGFLGKVLGRLGNVSDQLGELTGRFGRTFVSFMMYEGTMGIEFHFCVMAFLDFVMYADIGV